MQKLTILLLCLIIFFPFAPLATAQSYNFDIEKLDAKGKPLQWQLGFNEAMLADYPVVADSVIKHNGNYSLRLSSVRKGSEFGSCSLVIPSTYGGSSIVFKGFIKTENVTGWAGLWCRLDGDDAMLGFDNMENRPIKGTNEWKEFVIRLPFSEDVQKINAGALLIGDGTVWIDDLKVEIDQKDLSLVPIKLKKVYPAKSDTAFTKRSGLNFNWNPQRQEALTALGQVWGFLKYHHPAIAAGNYNWDAELIRVLPSMIDAKSKDEWMASLEKWVDKLPPIPACTTCNTVNNKDQVMLQPDYADLFKPGYLSSGLFNKLLYIQKNADNSFNYYVAHERGVGNPRFTNENPYNGLAYPDAGIRLLALYRYWNQIQYFFPYRHLIEENWNKMLPAFIPAFINAKDSTEYVLACLKLIAAIHDTHANVWGDNRTLNAFKGNYYTPFSATFIEDQLIVKNFYTDTAGIKNLISRGDIITHVNGKPVKELVSRLLEITPASNYSTQLRGIPASILRGNTNNITLTIIKNKKTEIITVPRYERRYLNFYVDYDPSPSDSSYKIINGDIGYVFPGKYLNKQLPAIIKKFKDTKGIVVDMRCYPSEFMPFTFGNYIKTLSTPFAKFTGGSVQHPGSFTFTSGASNGGNSAGNYKGKVIVIVNEETQSQAEYTTMAFQSSPNVTVIGSTTAGADGNVSSILLPGGISTMISGIGIYYPNKNETQRTGVKIDQVVKPTVKGFQEGRDELLEKAVQLINGPESVSKSSPNQ